jgi:mRNA-degrading endonuclease RelE of RelBE toxin-antitoxin system
LYEITFASSAKREFRDLTPEVIERIQPKIRDLANDPATSGVQKASRLERPLENPDW